MKGYTVNFYWDTTGSTLERSIVGPNEMKEIDQTLIDLITNGGSFTVVYQAHDEMTEYGFWLWYYGYQKGKEYATKAFDTLTSRKGRMKFKDFVANK